MPEHQGKPRLLVVGAYPNSASTSGWGGQMETCYSLLASPLRDRFEIEVISTMAIAIPQPPRTKRLLLIAKRNWVFYRRLSSFAQCCLIFSANGTSFLEKAWMAYLARRKRAGCIMALRAELLLDECRRSRVWRWFVVRCLRKVEIIWVQAQKFKDYLVAQGIDAARVYVLKNWVDRRLLDGWRADCLQKRIIFLGWLIPMKGVFDLLEAFRIASPNAPDWELHVAGEGQQVPQIKVWIRRHGLENRIFFRGWVRRDERFRFLTSGSILVLPSHTEGMPNVVLEAMAAGLAIVATRVGGVPELVVDMHNGLLVPARNPQALADKLVLLMRDEELRRSMGIANVAAVGQSHDLESAWPQIAEWIETVVAASRTHATKTEN